MANKNYTLPEIRDFAKEFVSILDEIYRREIVRFNWRDVIFNRSVIGASANPNISDTRGLLYRHHKQFRAFAVAAHLYPLSAQSLARFSLEIRGASVKIEPYDLELAKRLRYFDVPSRPEFEWLKPIVDALNQDPQLAIIQIKTHYQEIMQKLRAFNDKKTAYELRRLIALVTGSEINELLKCENDINRWNDYLLKFGIAALSQRLEMYLRGSKNTTDDISGQIYLGLASNFKDADLAKQMMQVPEIRNIWTCQQQLTLFNNTRYYVIEALRQPLEFYRRGKYEFRVNRDNSVDYRAAGSRDRWRYSTPFNADYIRARGKEFEKVKEPDDAEEWSLFLGTEERNYKDGFIHNLRAGEKYIETVRNKFGNAVFADFLDATEQKYHQSPTDWYRELMKFEPEFKNSLYRDIEPAKQALTAIFNARMGELMNKRSSAVNELRAALNARVKELQDAKATVQSKFGKMLKKHRKKLLKNWEREKREYEANEGGALLALLNFKERSEKVLDRIDRRKKYVKYKMVLNYSLKGDLFLAKQLEGMSAHERNELLLDSMEGRTLYGLYQRYRLARAEDEAYDGVETVEESDVEELRNLINFGRKIILPNLDKLLAYIYGKVNQYFLPETKEVLKQYSSTKPEELEETA